ncbi:hypothetical protein ACWOFR_08625 [Carnobacterium gallinarum]|uniref:hypothetical protein n=1 Tax=Carnobacterium gallinarum TaxID=2749 RepID=UPI00054E7AD9|nr:hypothetical protein [Carnobacterium gallinarum]
MTKLKLNLQDAQERITGLSTAIDNYLVEIDILLENVNSQKNNMSEQDQKDILKSMSKGVADAFDYKTYWKGLKSLKAAPII